MSGSELKSVDIEDCKETHGSSKSSVLMGVANLVNFTVGAGVIGLPNTFCKIGTALSLPILLLTGVLVTWGARIVVKAKERTGLTTMVDMAESLLGRIGFWFLSISEWFFYFCAMITYTVMTSQFTFPLLRYLEQNEFAHLKSDYYRIFVAIMVAVILPTLLLKDLSVLGKISTVASFSILLLAIMTTAGVITSNMDKTIVDNTWPMTEQYNIFDILGSMGCVLFALYNVPGIPDIHKSLENPSKIQLVAMAGNGITILFYLWIALPVYLFTGSRQCSCEKFEEPDGSWARPLDKLYVELFSKTWDGQTSLLMISISSLSVAINVCCSIPIYHFILRERSYKLFSRIRGADASAPMPSFFFFAHSLIYVPVAAIAISMPDVLFFLDFVGSIAGSSFLLIIPALLAMSIENGGIAHNVTYTYQPPKNQEKGSFAYMILLNAVLYFGGMIFFNSFYILASVIIKNA